MNFRAFPTIFPTGRESASGENKAILLYAPGGSRIPNLLIRSHWINGSPDVATQRLSPPDIGEICTDSATAEPLGIAQNRVMSHDFPHGFFAVIRHCIRWINGAFPALTWLPSAHENLTSEQRFDAARWAL